MPTGDVHDVKGFGLGLAYIKKIIELHGGTIELQSELGSRNNIHYYVTSCYKEKLKILLAEDDLNLGSAA